VFTKVSFLTLSVALLSVALLSNACSPARALPPRDARLLVTGTPQTARITLDDVPIGPLDQLGGMPIAVTQGKHRVSVTSAGYFPEDREIMVGAVPAKVDVQLKKLPE
jgi:hypothetical protein